MSNYITVAKVGEIAPGKGKCCRAGERRVALFFVDGQYYAMDDYCPHMGAPLFTGDVNEGQVVCDRHLWAFNLATGVCPDAPSLKAEVFPVRIVGDEIQVDVPPEA